MNADQKAAFAARMARIQSGGLNTNRTVFVGMDEAIAVPKGGAQKIAEKRAAKPQWMKQGKRKRPSVAGYLIALALGALSLPAVLFIMLNPAVSGQVQTPPGGPLGAALGLALITAFVLGLRSPVKLGLVATGVLAMSAGFHNLIHLAPEQVAQIYPATWVNAQLAATQAGTLVSPTLFLTL